MRRIRSLTRLPAASTSRYVRPRLEALEDRFLLSVSPLPVPAFNQTSTSMGLSGLQDIVLPDGKILVGGNASEWASPVSYFPPPFLIATPLAPQIIVGFPWYGPQTTSAIELVCFNADGTLDRAFGNGGVVVFQPGASDTFQGFALQRDGKIVVAGTNSEQLSHYQWNTIQFSPYGVGYSDFAYVPQDHEMIVARFNEDGSLDKSFNDGYQITAPGDQSYALGVVIQADGKIVVSGQFGGSSPTGVVVRYNDNGSLDTSFNPSGAQPGIVSISLPDALYIQGGPSAIGLEADGTIVVAFGASTNELVVYRLNTDGSSDSSFGSDGMATYIYSPNTNPGLRSLTIQADGKVVVAEDEMQGQSPLLLIRFDTDGSLDTSFGQGGIVETATNPDQNAFDWEQTGGLLVQPDGKIVVARATSPSDPVDAAQVTILRFNADGSLDTSFGPGGAKSSPIESASPGSVSVSASVALAPDGSLIGVGSVEVEFELWSPFYYSPLDLPDLRLTMPAVKLVVPELTLINFSYQPPPVNPAPIVAPVVPAPVSLRGPFLQSGAEPALQTAVTPSDSVFQSLATGAGARDLVPAGLQVGTPLPTSQLAVPSIAISLPVVTESQSAAVARLSGGGGETIAADEVFGLTGEPDSLRNLVLAGPANASE